MSQRQLVSGYRCFGKGTWPWVQWLSSTEALARGLMPEG